MNSLVPLRKVLVNADAFSWDDSLFLPNDQNWSLDSLGAVLNTDDLGDDEEAPLVAIENGLIYVFSIQTIQDIVDNARAQRPKCSDNDLFDAFQFYHQNDAFISFPP